MTDRKIYHVSPLRLWTVPIIFIVIAVFMLTVARSNAGTANTGMASVVIGIFFLFFAVLMYWIIARTRLVLDTSVLRLHQFGYTLETEWTNISCFYDEPGSEGLVLLNPMDSYGSHTLSANRQAQSQPGVSLYSDEQIQLIAEHRLIPIGAFTYWMKRGLRDELARRAPSLKNCSELRAR